MDFRKQTLFCICIFFLGLLVLGFRLGVPSEKVFDEVHYVPAALQFVSPLKQADSSEPQKPINLEHPPLAKLIIASGIFMFGDNPVGWRVMSVVFGSLLLVVFYLWGLILFDNTRSALVLVALTLCNQMLYVVSRVAMLEIYIAFFTILTLYFFHLSLLKTKRSNLYFYMSALAFGLAVACKLSAAVLAILYIVWFFVERATLIQIRIKKIFFFICLSLCIYALTFLPYYLDPRFHLSVTMFFQQQVDMLLFHQKLYASHPYQSKWYSWALMRRPIWFYYEAGTTSETFRGVLFLGNPLITWSGFLAFLVVCYNWLQTYQQRLLYLILAFLSLYYLWAFIPRNITFFYYYFPAALLLPIFILLSLGEIPLVSLRNWVHRIFLIVSMMIFLLFLPVLSAVETDKDFLKYVIWFRTWI